jgi:hypothetical protein
VNEFVAAQPAAGAPWRATLLIQYGGTTLSETPTLIADGYASPGPDTGIVPGLLDDYANYYQAIKHTGAKPESTVLDDGPFTSDLQIYDPPQAQAERGITLTGSYFVDPKDPIYTFAAGGGTTACGAIRYTSTMTSLDGTPLPASRSLDEWAMRIAQGSYSSMTLTGLHMACFYRRDGSATWTVIANWGGNASVSGR